MVSESKVREILFRGKRTDNGEWAYGFYNEFAHRGTGEQEHFIQTVQQDGRIDYIRKVDPKTVGQFTGLTDMNDKRIFEGDIIRYNTFDDFDCHSVVKFGEYEQDGSGGEYNPLDCIGWYAEVDNFTCPDWADDDPIYFNDYLMQQNLLEVSAECEVIGNIHDNPDLLEGSHV